MEFDELAVSAVLATCCQQVQDATSNAKRAIAHAACAVCIALTCYGADLQNIEAALLAAELDDHYGVLVDFIALLHENAQLASAIVANPQPMLELLEDALLTAQVGSPAELLGQSSLLTALRPNVVQQSIGLTSL
jgi:hypothetical protein